MTTRDKIVYINDRIEGKIALSSSVNSVDDITVPNSFRCFVFNGIDSRVQINRHVTGQANRMMNGCKFVTTIMVLTPEYSLAKVGANQPIFSCIRPDGSRRMEVGIVPIETGDNAYEKFIYVAYRNNEDFAYVTYGKRHLSGIITLAVDWIADERIKVLVNGRPEIDEPITLCEYQPWEYEADGVTLKAGEVTYLGANPIRKEYFEGKIWSFSEQSYMTTDRTAEMVRFLSLLAPEPFLIHPSFFPNDLMTGLSLSDRGFTAEYVDPIFEQPTTAKVDFDVLSHSNAYMEFIASKDVISAGYGVCSNADSVGNGLFNPTATVDNSIYMSATTGAIKVVSAGEVTELQTGKPITPGERIGVKTEVTGSKLTSVRFFREGSEIGDVSGLSIPVALRQDCAVAVTFIGGSVGLNTGEKVFAYGTSDHAVVVRTPAVAERESILFDGEKIAKAYFPFTKSTPGYDEYNSALHDVAAAGITTNQAPFNAGSGASATFAGNSFTVAWPFEGKDFVSYFLPAASVVSFCFKPEAADLVGDVQLVSFRDREFNPVLKVHLVNGEVTVSVDSGAHVFTVAAIDFPVAAGQAAACAVHLEKVGEADREYRIGVWLDGDRLVSQAFTFAGSMSHLMAAGAASSVEVGGLQGRLSTLLLARKDGTGPFYRGGDLDADWRFKRIQSGAVSGGGGTVTGTVYPMMTVNEFNTLLITAACVADNGDIYIGGIFDEIDGVTGFHNLAKLPLGDTVWQKVPSSTALSGAIGYGINAYAINGLLATNGGHLYVVGNLGSSSPTYNVAGRIDLNTGAGDWIKHSAGVLHGVGYAVIRHTNETDVVICGEFKYTNASGQKYNYVVRAVPTSYKVLRYPATGLSGFSSGEKGVRVRCAAFSPAGKLYVGGCYTMSADDPVPSDSHAAVWWLDESTNVWRKLQSRGGSTPIVGGSTLGWNESATMTTEVKAIAFIGSVLFAGGTMNNNVYLHPYYGLAKLDVNASPMPDYWEPVTNGVDIGLAAPVNGVGGINASVYNIPSVETLLPLIDGSLLIGGRFSPKASHPAFSHGLIRFVPGDQEFVADPPGLSTGTGYGDMKVTTLAACRANSVNPYVVIVGNYRGIGATSIPGGVAKYGP